MEWICTRTLCYDKVSMVSDRFVLRCALPAHDKVSFCAQSRKTKKKKMIVQCKHCSCDVSMCDLFIIYRVLAARRFLTNSSFIYAVNGPFACSPPTYSPFTENSFFFSPFKLKRETNGVCDWEALGKQRNEAKIKNESKNSSLFLMKSWTINLQLLHTSFVHIIHN